VALENRRISPAELTEEVIGVLGVLVLLVLSILTALFVFWGRIWVYAYFCDADVSFKSLIAMSLLRIDHQVIVAGKIMASQAGISIDRHAGMTTDRLISHYLAGGNVTGVVQSLIVAAQSGKVLDFARAADIDLAGRDLLLAVRTSVTPIVISCPRQDGPGAKAISAVAIDGVELLVKVKITVRTNMDQLVGGATEDTIIARVGHAIIAAVGSSITHRDVLASPSVISDRALKRRLDANTAFSIISIDISGIQMGENIGARLQMDQADADMLMAQASAENRLAAAIAQLQEMHARVRGAQAKLLRSESLLPSALAAAFRSGQDDEPHDGPFEGPHPLVPTPGLRTKESTEIRLPKGCEPCLA
jgi:uncharacterized protein YqfA (UPF0365 family)